MFPDVFVCAGDEAEFSTYEKAVAAPLFRKIFDVCEVKGKASLTIGCTGFYDIFLNGENITDGFLAPFVANSDKTVFYRKYDVTDTVRESKNELLILLGNGFANPVGGEIWGLDKRDGRAAPKFAMEFECGGVKFSASDMEWVRSGLLFDDYRIGTYYDARVQDEIESGKSVWQKPTVASCPKGKKRFVTCEPIRAIREVKPAYVRTGELRDYRIRDVFAGKLHTECSAMPVTPVCGGYIYDFGENVSAIPRLKIKGERGQVVHLQFCEFLFEGFADYINVDVYPDGCCQKDVYVCKGEGEETYVPPFTYHGARYCYVYGITPEQATEDLLTLLVVHNDVKKRSWFECSDEISNEIFRVCRRSDESNLHNIITDCPTREKNGWTGDAAISADHYLFGYAAESCFYDWLASIRDFQWNHGGITCIVPCGHGLSDSVVWDSILFFLPYYAYIYSGRTDIIEENAEAMIKNLSYHLSLRDSRGIVDRGMGDWVPVNSAAAAYASPLGFCCSAVMLEMCRMGMVMFDKIGKTEHLEFCKKAHDELLAAIRNEYLVDGVITAGKTAEYVKPLYRPCQTSQALGLYFGIFTEEERHKALDKLVSLIHENNDSFDCGFLGIRTIFHVLAENGYASLAYKMITKPTHPSYANMIYRGETTVWERFCPPGERTGSHNHHFLAEPSAWYLRYIAGIRVNPGLDNCNKVVISPIFIDELTYASGYYDNGTGRVEVRWDRDTDGKIKLCVKASGGLEVALDEKVINDNVTINFS